MSFIDDINEMRKNLRDTMGIPPEYFRKEPKVEWLGVDPVQEVKDPDFHWWTERDKNLLDPDMEVSSNKGKEHIEFRYYCNNCAESPDQLYEYENGKLLCIDCTAKFNSFIRRKYGVSTRVERTLNMKKLIHNRSIRNEPSK